MSCNCGCVKCQENWSKDRKMMGYVPEFASYKEVLISELPVERGPAIDLYEPETTDRIYQADNTVMAEKKDSMFENLTALHYVSIIGLLGAATFFMRGK